MALNPCTTTGMLAPAMAQDLQASVARAMLVVRRKAPLSTIGCTTDTVANHAMAGQALRIVALVVGPIERARLETAVKGLGTAVFVSTIAIFRERALLTVPRITIVVAEPRDADGMPTAPLLKQLRDAHPETPIIVYCSAGGHDSREILEMAGIGVHDLIFRGATDTPVLLRATFESAARTCGAETILGRIRDILIPEGRQIVEYCLFHPTLATSVEAVAHGLGLHRKTLVNRCARVGLPVPGVLIAWSRLLLFGHTFRTRCGPVEDVALLIGFPSGTALRNMLKRYCGLRPRDLQGSLGLEQLLTKFRHALAAAALCAPRGPRTGAESLIVDPATLEQRRLRSARF
jgi:hypothetical protein